MLKLAVRVAKLEREVVAQGEMLERVRKQPAIRPRTNDSSPQTRIVESGIDCYGVPEVIVERVRRARGRPSGSRDHAPRARRRKPEGVELYHREDIEALAEPPLLDRDWDR
jgi:hypothetical protein